MHRLAAILARNSVPLVLVAILSLFAINTQSFWGDEFATILISLPALWSDWLVSFATWEDSDSQVPLYNFYIKLWTLVFPTTELWLRLSNLPWILVLFLSLWNSPVTERSRWLPRFVLFVLFIHPLIWYYANEARQYFMLLAGAALAFAGLLGLLDIEGESGNETAALVMIVVGAGLMTLTSLTGLLWSITFAGPAVAIHIGRHGARFPQSRALGYLVVVSLLAFIIPAVIYYKYTMARGVVAAEVGNKLSNYLFSFYEISGLSGLGPGRIELRAAEAQGRALDLVGTYAFTLALPALAVCLIFYRGLVSSLISRRKQLLLVIACALIPFMVFAIMAMIKNFRIVGRHLLPLMLPYALIMALGLRSVLRESVARFGPHRRLLWGAVAATYAASMLVSTLSISFGDRHRRDDHRRATGVARAALDAGQLVWWGADRRAVTVYGLGPMQSAGHCSWSGEGVGAMVDVSQADPESLAGCPWPDVVILAARAKAYGSLGGMLTTHSYKITSEWPGFEIWGRSAPRSGE